MIIHSGIFTAFVNGKNTNVDFNGKFNSSKSVIRITWRHYQKRHAQAISNAIMNDFVTKENYNNGFYDMHFEDEDHNKYKFDYRANGFSNNLDNGYFLKKMN